MTIGENVPTDTIRRFGVGGKVITNSTPLPIVKNGRCPMYPMLPVQFERYKQVLRERALTAMDREAWHTMSHDMKKVKMQEYVTQVLAVKHGLTETEQADIHDQLAAWLQSNKLQRSKDVHCQGGRIVDIHGLTFDAAGREFTLTI
jgi:dihydrofolate reductase